MLSRCLAIVGAVVLTSTTPCASSAQSQTGDSALVRSIFNEVLTHGQAHENLRVLCKDIGHRLSGSPQADSAIAWGLEAMMNAGADTAYVMPVEVPSWSRGSVAECRAMFPEFPEQEQSLRITALGGSVPTPNDDWIRGELIVVKSLDALDTLDAKGKIVLFNRAMDPVMINTGAAYGGAWDQRGLGAVAAAKAGAVGVLVRSLTHALDTVPHTGALNYDTAVKAIPAAAISTVDASALARGFRLAEEQGQSVVIKFKLNCRERGQVMQGNVVGEWRGSELDHEIITLGGHLDSWDIGEGAHDDGAGVVHSIEALRTLKAVGYQPRRTLRFVLFINEENGNRGGKTYAQVAAEEHVAGLRHVAAMESDAGGFVPRGVRMDGLDPDVALVRDWSTLLEPYNLHYFGRGGSGVDIGPLKELVPRPLLMGLVPDGQRYFDVHHTSQDVWENVHKRELELGAATCASMVALLDLHLPAAIR